MCLHTSVRSEHTRGSFYYHLLPLIQAWISNYIHYKMWNEITYPFLHFNGGTVEVQGMDKWCHPTLYCACDYSSMLELKLTHVSKRGYCTSVWPCEVIWRQNLRLVISVQCRMFDSPGSKYWMNNCDWAWAFYAGFIPAILHNDFMTEKHFQDFWPFVWRIHMITGGWPSQGISDAELWHFHC